MEKTVDYKGCSLQYDVVGSGACAVLLHGFGENKTVWNNVLPMLSGFQLIVPNLPGTGSSQLTEDMSMEGLAEAVRFILQQQKIEKCVLIGHSMGGYITLAFADQYPQLLAGFGLFHSTAYADTQEKIEARRRGIEFIAQYGSAAFLKTSVPNLYAPATKEGRPALLQEHLDAVKDSSEAALTAYYASMIKRPDRTAVLTKATVPVLFVLGAEDKAVPLEDGLALCHLPSFSYIHILKQSGHMGMNEETEKSATILQEFLSDTL